METILILTLLIIIILFALSNIAFLNSKDTDRIKSFRRIFYPILIVFSIGFFGIFFLDGITLIEKTAFFLIGVIINPLLIIFPFSNLKEKINNNTKDKLSKSFIIIYNLILLFGLVGMTSPGNTWGNSSLFGGLLLVIWALPNILLAGMMTNDFKFSGTIKSGVGIISIVIIALTIKTNEYSGNLEQSLRTITFLFCGYYTFEGYLYRLKHKKITQI